MATLHTKAARSSAHPCERGSRLQAAFATRSGLPPAARFRTSGWARRSRSPRGFWTSASRRVPRCPVQDGQQAGAAAELEYPASGSVWVRRLWGWVATRPAVALGRLHRAAPLRPPAACFPSPTASHTSHRLFRVCGVMVALRRVPAGSPCDLSERLRPA
eukprot:357241-Chlamydomonas_euryale.AAC.13